MKKDKFQIYQIGTINSLLEAVYEGDLTIKELKSHGDFGLGALDNIDGEMILYDGVCYRANAFGGLNVIPDYNKTPFAMVNKFVEEKSFSIKDVDYATLEKFLSKKFVSNNLIYAIKLHGTFRHIQLRSEHCTCRPYQKLVKILPSLQTTFSFENVTGVLVGFWFPQYMSQLNVPGFHFHFIDDNRTIGGHVFGLELDCGMVSMQELHGFQMELIRSDDFYNADLSQTKASDVAQVEQVRVKPS